MFKHQFLLRYFSVFSRFQPTETNAIVYHLVGIICRKISSFGPHCVNCTGADMRYWIEMVKDWNRSSRLMDPKRLKVWKGAEWLHKLFWAFLPNWNNDIVNKHRPSHKHKAFNCPKGIHRFSVWRAEYHWHFVRYCSCWHQRLVNQQKLAKCKS